MTLRLFTSAGLAWALLGAPAVAAPAADPLDGLVQAAIAAHPSVAAARQDTLAAEARTGVRESAYWPQVNLTSGLSRTTSVSAAQTTAQPFTLGSGGLGVRQQIWDFGKNASDVEVAKAATLASEAALAQREVDVAYGVRKAYLEWLRAGGLATQARERERASTRLFEQAKALWQAGRRAKIDVTRAEASMQQARAEALGAENDTRLAVRSLAAALGGGVPVPTTEPAFPALPTLAAAPLDALLKQAESHHPALAAERARLASANATRVGAERAGWPDITGDASYGLRTRDDALNQNWAAGVNLNVPLFTGFSLTHQREAALAGERAAQASLSDQAIAVSLGIERARLAVEGARTMLPAVEASARAARENLRLAEGRYQAGVGTIIEVSDAQALLAGAQADLVRARVELHLAASDLLRAVGETGVAGQATKGAAS